MNFIIYYNEVYFIINVKNYFAVRFRRNFWRNF